MAIKKEINTAFKRRKTRKGFTLIELMVVVSLFALVFAVGSGMFFSVIKNSNKIKNLNQVKQNGEYATSVMERMIRNARRVTDFDSVDNEWITIVNPDGGETTFACMAMAIDADPVIASASAFQGVDLYNFSLIGSEVKTDNCSITVTNGVIGVKPAVVEISFTLVPTDTNLRAEEQVSVDFQTTVALRNY